MHANQMPVTPARPTTTTTTPSLPALTRPGRTPDGGRLEPLVPAPATSQPSRDDDQGGQEDGYGYGV